jgi:hypothetical protein
MFDFTQQTTSLIYREGNESIISSLKTFLQEVRQPTLPIIPITFLVIEKFLCFQDHHPTGLDHISNERGNMQNIWFLEHMDSLHSLRSNSYNSLYLVLNLST